MFLGQRLLQCRAENLRLGCSPTVSTSNRGRRFKPGRVVENGCLRANLAFFGNKWIVSFVINLYSAIPYIIDCTDERINWRLLR